MSLGLEEVGGYMLTRAGGLQIREVRSLNPLSLMTNMELYEPSHSAFLLLEFYILSIISRSSVVSTEHVT
jgi:hypothetical protein